MPRYAAFLRAVNLGSTRKLTSAELREHFGTMGFEDVATFRTSGNVIFGGASGGEAKVKAKVEKALWQAAGFEVVVFLRTDAQLRAMAGHQPFPAKQVEA